ncbi:MAG: UvrB/UvrC motif-containing protein [Planctomycetes bacterium]|nr:UvrB/UvrC motif-containing protein [Planctomycetota bacterium]
MHLTEIEHQNVRKEIHLCDECAKTKGINFKVPLAEILSGVIEVTGRGLKDLAELKCPKCGITYAEFRQRTRLGCPHDYVVFRGGLLPLLEKIHGATQHRGKAPATFASAARARETKEHALETLEKELDRLVKAEEYEKAAEVRDRIRQLKEPAE